MIEVQGSPNDLAQSGVDFAKLVGLTDKSVDILGEISDAQVSSVESMNLGTISKPENEKIDENVKQQEQEKDEGLQMEDSSKGKVKGSVSWSYFTAGAHWFILIILASSFLIVQMFASGADYWVSVW